GGGGGEGAGGGGAGGGGGGGLRGEVREGAVAVVAVERVGAVARHVEVGEAVVVVVSHRHPHPVAVLRHPREARLLRDVAEGAVLLLVVEAVPELPARLVRLLSLGHRVLELRAVREED